ncbi:glycosyltransferase family 25 protein [Synechococcus sp. MU1650]|uniref:glycosyltransferase family 25 protein n=1 Tax=Synechococcus sp. MU1650 TaxID=2508352 RepID=UPI001CF8E4CE|nr:glycosyltransferase family 25 protein [Synechococcus sp. MU1650]MCB4378580.1 glycosyltransferase family 25 protein [Synechococcus sp. MU1650]
MASIEGRIISLIEAKSRQQNIYNNLKSLKQFHNYQFFTAIRGSDRKLERRGLSKGEHGLWQSVLSILDDTKNIKGNYIHLLEDDAVISDQFFRWAENLPVKAGTAHIYFTDMWVGKQNFSQLKSISTEAKKSNKIFLVKDKGYSGCTSSWLIHKDHIPHVRSLLKHGFQEASRARIPIDNFIRSLIYKGQIRVKISLPFLTSICLKDQYKSSIQDSSTESILATRLFECFLRRRLSVLSRPQDLKALQYVLNAFMTTNEIDDWIEEILIPFFERNNKYRYTLDTRLAGEPRNEQSSPH